MEYLIVSRHPAAIEFIRRDPLFADAPVVAEATVADVRDKIVAGNLPLHLAQHAVLMVAVEFSGTPPRGQEYSADDMAAAGAHLAVYQVTGTVEQDDLPDRIGRPTLLDMLGPSQLAEQFR